MTDYQGKQSYHYEWKVLGMISGKNIIIMKQTNLKYYAQVGELPLWGCDQWCIYQCTNLACAQGPLKFLHSGVSMQTLKHLGSNQELF